MSTLRHLCMKVAALGLALVVAAALGLAAAPAGAQLALTGAGKGVIGGASGSLTCGTFTDNFNDATKGVEWAATTLAPGGDSTASLGGGTSEATGAVVVTGFTASTYQFNGYSTASPVSIATGTSVWVKATPTGNIWGEIEFWDSGSASNARFVRVQIDNTNGFSRASNNNFGAGGTFWGASNSVTYDSTNHAWLGIRNSGTQFEAYTAADAGGVPGTWVLRGTTSAGYFTPSSVHVFIGAVSNHGSPGSLTLDGYCTGT